MARPEPGVKPAAGDELRSGRSQHTYAIPPQDVREASAGTFWIVQEGANVKIRALPTRAVQPAGSHPAAPTTTHPIGDKPETFDDIFQATDRLFQSPGKAPIR